MHHPQVGSERERHLACDRARGELSPEAVTHVLPSFVCAGRKPQAQQGVCVCVCVCGVCVLQAPGDLQAQAGPSPSLGLLHACRERATQLEDWLERARHDLGQTRGPGSMQVSVEQQLLTCQVIKLNRQGGQSSTLGSVNRCECVF